MGRVTKPGKTLLAEWESLLALDCWTPDELARWRTWATEKATGKTMWAYVQWLRCERFRRQGTAITPTTEDVA